MHFPKQATQIQPVNDAHNSKTVKKFIVLLNSQRDSDDISRQLVLIYISRVLVLSV